jgi:hypothetical protein
MTSTMSKISNYRIINTSKYHIFKKKGLILFISSFLLFSFQSEGQAKENEINQTVVTNLFSMLPVGSIPFFSVSYHIGLDENSSIGAEIRLPLLSTVDGLGYGIEYRVFPFSEQFGRGFYISPRIIYTEIKSNLEKDNIQNSEIDEVKVFAFGILGAYQFILGNHFTVGFGFGLEYYTGPSLQGKELGKKMSNKLPHFRFDMGWSF